MNAPMLLDSIYRAQSHQARPNDGRALRRLSWLAASFALLLLACSTVLAQTGGEGAIQGTVTDATGAAVSGALVTATNIETGVKTTQPASSAGLYNITPLIPGTYNIDVSAKGFEGFKQENMEIDALHVTGLNVKLKIGSQSEQITVTEAPPVLETTNATLGGTIQSDEYLDLPLLMTSGQQRDITQFSNLLPGAQLNPGGRSSIIGGTQQRLGEVYLDGLPLTTISQQGDNRPIFNVVPSEAIGQIQVVTSGFSAEYQGAGLENYTMKSGTNKYHGTVADFFRNRIFDTWGFAAPWTRVVNGTCLSPNPCYANNTPNVYGHSSKPADHQNEFTFSIGGPVSIPHLFDGKDKLFLHFTLDKTGSLLPPSTAFFTIPTALMQGGNFCELLLPTTAGGCGTTAAPNFQIYDPTTLRCPTPTTCQRTAIPNNILPAAEISSISKYLQKFLPAPTNGNLTSNYLGGTPTGYQNFLFGERLDWDISPRQRISFAASNGRRHAVPYTSGAGIPVPYLPSTLSSVVGNFYFIEHTFTINPHLVNQFNVGYMYFGGPPTQNSTEGITQYEATTAGITGLPAGQGSDEFPGVSFAGTDGGTEWQQPDVTSKTVSHTYDIIDNVNWVLGRHSLNLGIQLQDLMENASTNNSYSSPITYSYNPNDTSQLLAGSSGAYSYNTPKSGFAYASYLLGAVDSSSVTLQPFSDVGSRYHTVAPYAQDDFKITSKLTLNLGLRWDYMPGFREVLDRWSFLNPTLTNPYTGNPGSLQFAGNYGGTGVSCGCTTPVNTYWKNWGPRVGFAYAPTTTTVIRGGFAILYSHGGGTGGAGATGTGQTGFNDPVTIPAIPAGASANAAFYLNNSGYNAQLNNTNFGGPGFVLPSIPAVSATTQLSDGQIGNFVNSSGAFVQSKNGIAYADPYYGDRTPTLNFFNFGMQQAFTQSITFTLNYVGSVSHFLSGASNIRGLQSGEINPIYLPLIAGNLINAAATPTNIAAAQAIIPGCCGTPYPGFAAAAATSAGSTIATIGQSLKWMPQYSGTSDTWGAYSANAAYNALQASIAIRPTRGLTFNFNYTWSKEMDDAGTIRTGYPIAAAQNATGRAWKADRMDRSLSTIDTPQNLAAYGVYKLPFGKGAIGGSHFIVRALAGGWTFSSIVTYQSGYPLTLSSSSCISTTLPGQGTCMPDVNPAFSGPIKTSNWPSGVTALNLGTKSYINEGLGGTAGYNASTVAGAGGQNGTTAVPCAQSGAPFCNPAPGMIGDAARTGAFGLRTPGNFRLTSGLRRVFPIHDSVNFEVGVDCQNVTNSVTFGENVGNLSVPTGINTSSFGTLNFASSDSRDFQFSGRVNF